LPGATGFDSFTYFVGDGIVADSARVTIEIKPNSQPVLVDDTFTVSINSTNNLLDVLANDSDPDGDTLTITSLTEPAHGQVTLEAGNSVLYTPDPAYSGTDTFYYTVVDGWTGVRSARVTVHVSRPNSPPVLVDDTFTVSINSTNNLLDVLANDSDPDGDTLTITSLTEAAHGQVFLEVNNRLRYTPDLRFSGVDTFYYTVDDGWTGVSTASVTVNVVMPHSVYLPLILTP